MDNAVIIAKYCETTLINNEYFINYISENLNFILLMLDDSIVNHKTKLKIESGLKLQRYFNKKVEQQILDIQKTNGAFIGLKGYFLQCAYYPQKYTRLYGDIDILINKKIGFSFYKSMKKNGYTLVSRQGLYRKIIHGDFVVSLMRNLYTNNNKHLRLQKGNSSIVEVHTNINNNRLNTSFNIDRMISEAVAKEYGSLCFYILSPEDNLLYLIAHTINHLSYIDLYDNKLSVNLQKIYDVAQIINNEKINWDLFTERAKEYDITPAVTLFIKMFNGIFENMIPKQVFENSFEAAKQASFSWKDLFTSVIDLSAEELILGDYRKVPIIMQYYEKAKLSVDSEKTWKEFNSIISKK